MFGQGVRRLSLLVAPIIMFNLCFLIFKGLAIWLVINKLGSFIINHYKNNNNKWIKDSNKTKNNKKYIEKARRLLII